MLTLHSTSTSPSRILVLVNKHLPGITVYDADTLKPICQTKTGVAPHEVALSANGRHAYVPIYGSSGVGKPGTDEHMFYIFRTSDCTEVAAMDTGDFKRLHSVVVARNGLVYVSAETAAAVIIIDPEQRRIIGHIPTGSHTSHMIALNHDESRIYSSNVQSNTVSVLDINSRQIVETVNTGSENQRMTLSPDGLRFVTSLGPAKKIAFYRTTDNKLDFEVAVDGRPFVAKFSHDGKYLYNVGITDGKTRAWKIDVAARAVVATEENLGNDPGSLEVNPFTADVYISDQPSRQVIILDAASWRSIKAISTDAAPDAMAFATVS